MSSYKAVVLPAVLGILLALSGALYAQMINPRQLPRPTILPPITLATSIFEDQGSIKDWFPVGNSGRLERTPGGGLPGGFLHASGFVGGGWCGARTRRSEFVGAYSRSGAITFDLKLAVQQITDAKVHLMLENSPGLEGSNWLFDLHVPFAASSQRTNVSIDPSLLAEQVADNKAWSHLYIPFNPSWTDEQAIASGWHRQATSPPKSWAETLRNVLWVSVVVERPGATYASPNYVCTMDIDNFWVQR